MTTKHDAIRADNPKPRKLEGGKNETETSNTGVTKRREYNHRSRIWTSSNKWLVDPAFVWPHKNSQTELSASVNLVGSWYSKSCSCKMDCLNWSTLPDIFQFVDATRVKEKVAFSLVIISLLTNVPFLGVAGYLWFYRKLTNELRRDSILLCTLNIRLLTNESSVSLANDTAEFHQFIVLTNSYVVRTHPSEPTFGAPQMIRNVYFIRNGST